ncbi:Bromodomain adjacent to zinc finger domain protein 2B [Manis javanica]|nr:Bromodomain adjacent to zinc finger domain protein 2B [Manis javanica]
MTWLQASHQAGGSCPKEQRVRKRGTCHLTQEGTESESDQKGCCPHHRKAPRYPNLEAFAVDVRLVFDNCEAFNQDDSDTGRAGHRMRKYFEKKWTDTLKVSRRQEEPEDHFVGIVQDNFGDSVLRKSDAACWGNRTASRRWIGNKKTAVLPFPRLSCNDFKGLYH